MTSAAHAVYVGLFRHNLDAKNRLTIPSKWRFAGDEEDVYLAVPHPDGYIAVLPPPEIQRLRDKVSEVKFGDRGGQDFMHRFFATAHFCGCDKQGRINLTPDLLHHAGISKETRMVGTMNRFAIWSPERWAAVDDRTQGEAFGDLMRQIDF